MKPSDYIIKFCKEFEGYHVQLPNGDCKAYADPGSDNGKPFTIGWGTTTYNTAGRAKYNRVEVQLNDTLTRNQAESEFAFDLNEVAEKINALGVNLNQNEFDAAISFFHNAGFPKPMVDRLKRSKKEFAEALELYVNGENGKPLAGLVRRRADEYELFNKPVESNIPKGDWWLVTKDGLFEMAGDKYISAFEFDGSFTLNSEQFRGHNVVFNMNRAKPKMWKPEVKPQGNTARLVKAIYTNTDWLVNNPFKGPWKELTPLILHIGDDAIYCASGQPGKQNFRLPNDPKSYPGCMEPLPQGKYTIGNISWAAGKDNYKGSHGAGLGPVWVPLTAQFNDDRSAFGLHLDENISISPGSAGCIVFASIQDLTKLVVLLRKYDPKTLDVNWEL